MLCAFYKPKENYISEKVHFQLLGNELQQSGLRGGVIKTTSIKSHLEQSKKSDTMRSTLIAMKLNTEWVAEKGGFTYELMNQSI